MLMLVSLSVSVSKVIFFIFIKGYNPRWIDRAADV